MPGSPLMCIWHACYVIDGGAQSTGLKQSVLKAVTQRMAAECGASFSAEEFDNFMRPDHVPDFDIFASYFNGQLTMGIVGTKYIETIRSVEKSCWSMSASAYQSTMLNLEEDKQHLWQIFNRLAEDGSFPPIANEAEITWLTKRIASGLGSPFNTFDAFPGTGMTFQALLDHLSSSFFVNSALTMLIHGTVTEIFNYSVMNVLATGWLHKRTRKHSNWTNWQRRWFVCEPGKLTYYENDDQSVKKGEVVIDANARVEGQEAFKGFMKSLSGRFKVLLSKNFDIEMATCNDGDRDRWMTVIVEVINAAREGITPFQHQLRDRSRKLKWAKNSPNSLSVSDPNFNYTPSPAGSPRQQRKENDGVSAPNKKQAGTFALLTPKTNEEASDIIDCEKQKIQAIFLKVDKNGNGRIEASEFKEFICNELHLQLQDNELNVIFSSLDKKKLGCIGFDEFYNYFVSFVLDENLTGAESQMRAAFLQADRNGTGTIDFREFSDFVWARRQTMTANKIAEIFDQMDEGKTGEVSFNDFKSFMSRQGSLKSIALKNRDSKAMGSAQQPSTSVSHLEEQFKNLYTESDAGEIVEFLRNRWQKFASFKRVGGAGELVMTGGSGMVADVLPGEYSLLDLACFSDLPPIIPHHVVIKGVQWISSTVPGVSGKLLFPGDFNGILPTDIATNAHLAYYDCSLADSSQLKVALLYRHGIQDFTYENNYLEEYIKDERKLGGGGLERHDFAHLDCPLDADNGYFVIGKLVNKTDLHLTGFKVPTRHTLYIPGGVIHCNDYLKGTWRTMLSDEADIDHAHIVRSSRRGNVTAMEHFVFSFDT